MPGWNDIVRLRRPRVDMIDGGRTFREAQPVG